MSLLIEMARGDLEARTFTVLDSDGEPFLETFDEIYFTVKKSSVQHDYIFQKRLSTAEIHLVEDGVYEFRIEPNDTDGLPYGDYAFDIELYIEGSLKKTFVGTLRLSEEVTHSYNEG